LSQNSLKARLAHYLLDNRIGFLKWQKMRSVKGIGDAKGRNLWFGLLVKQSCPSNFRIFLSPISFTLLSRKFSVSRRNCCACWIVVIVSSLIHFRLPAKVFLLMIFRIVGDAVWYLIVRLFLCNGYGFIFLLLRRAN
jgi:hypothetical protein